MFEVTEKGISIVGTTNQNIIDLTIPQTIKGYPVTNISYGALKGCKNIQSISFYENMNGLFRQIGELFGEHIQTSDEQFYFKQIDLDETRGDPRMFDPYYRIFYIPKTLKVICIQNYPEDSACTKETKREILTAKAQSEILVIFQNSR